MKLISCYIENYGSIKQKEFDFSNGLTSICKNNGYGKTTFASFLKAMFYGLEGYRTNSKDFSDRLHYFPFEGGQFGGNVTFEMNGKTYKIQRFFHEKSDTLDDSIVFCNGSPTKEFLNNEVGQCIFGIDGKSFERTIFIDSGEIEISSTASINNKLNVFLDGGNEVYFERCVDVLESKIKDYKKSRTGNDLISQTKEKIERLNFEITNAENIKNALAEKYERYNADQELRNTLKTQYDNARLQKLVLKDWEFYNAYKKNIEDNKRKIEVINNNYPFGLPTLEEVDRVSLKINKVDELKAQRSQCAFDNGDEGKLSKLSAKFSDNIPEKEELKRVEDAISLYSSLEGEINAMGQNDSSNSSRFDKSCPADAQVQLAKSALAKYRELTQKKDAQTIKTQNKEKKFNAVILLIPSLIFLLIGAGLVFIKSLTAIGISLAAIGLICTIISILLIFKGKKHKNVSQPTAQEKPSQQKCEELLASIKALIQPYGYDSDKGVIEDFSTFERDLLVYKEIKNRESEKNNKLKEKVKHKEELEKNLTSFFSQYGYNASFLNNLSELKKDLESYSDIKGRKQKLNENSENLSEKIAEHISYVRLFCEKYHFDIENIRAKISSITNDLRSLEDLNARVLKEERESEKFKSEKNLTTPPNQTPVDLYELNANLQQVTDRCNRLQIFIDNDECRIEQLDGLISDRDSANEKLQEYKKTYELLTATLSYVKQAEQNLQDRYISPIKNKFIDYSALLEKTLGEKVTMTKDFQISFERNGKERSEKYLSAGQRTICALCFRLALIWNMYEKEKPFIILDDPFLTLDGEHLKKVKSLLSSLSEKMQIIYLTCHESRAI